MIVVGGKAYELVHEHKAAWNVDAFKERYSEVLDRYDYIVGDWGYNQLRLKGFFREGNPKSTKDTSIAILQDYLQEYCNFGCAYFVLERKSGKEGLVNEQDSFEDVPDGEERSTGTVGGLPFSDRKPYAWRENQSTSRQSGRKADAERVSDAADKKAEGRPDAGRGGEGSRSMNGGQRHEGRGGAAHGGGRPDNRDRAVVHGAPSDRGTNRAGGGKKFHKGPKHTGNKGRGGYRSDSGGNADGGNPQRNRERPSAPRQHQQPE